MLNDTAIIKRATVDDIVQFRNQALTQYAAAHAAIQAAADAVDAAKLTAARASPGVNRYNYHQHEEKASFLLGIKVPDPAEFAAGARKLVDTDVWAYVIKLTDLERLMDKKAKDQLNQQLLVDPPEATVDNIIATVERFAAEAGTIFRRGIAECFSNLDRRFRSHDGWKIGHRVVLSHALNEYGGWNWHRNHEDTIRDIERTFHVLDGVEVPPDYVGLIAKINEGRRFGSGPRQGYVETEYFRVRTFMNGNCHVWFKRDDLLERVNQLLGEYYGAPIPEDRDADPDTGLNDPKTALAKNYAFFPTPDAPAREAIERAKLYRQEGKPPLRVLEPSAGTASLARRAVEAGAEVTCVEVHAERAAALRADGRYAAVHCCDFLQLQPETTGLFDRVLANPPHDRERDIDHVMHALKFLNDDGMLVAIMSAGTEFRETRKATAFRELMQKMNADWRDLPRGSFSEVGTNANTLILRVRKNGTRMHYYD